MNKILLSIVILTTGSLQAQKKEYGLKKGDVLIEGNFQFYSTKESIDLGKKYQTTMKENSSMLAPKAGFLISDKFLFGIELKFYRQSQEDKTLETKEKANEFYAGIYGRYYFLEVGSRLKTFSELSFGMSNQRITPNNTDAIKTTGYRGGVGLGVNYFVSPNIAVNFSLSDLLQFSTSSPLGEKMSDIKSVESGTNINVFNNFFSTATFGVAFKL